MLKVFSKFLFWLVLFILFSVVAVLFFSIQTQPEIINTSVVDARSAQHANYFLKRLKYSFNPSQQINSLVIKSSELTALSAILTRSEERLVTNADIEKNKLILHLTWQLPFKAKSLFLNIKLTILSSSKGLKINTLVVGDITFSGNAVLWVVKKSLNLMQAELGEQAFSAIKSVNINQQLIVLNYQIPQNFNLLNSQGKGRLFVLRDQLALFGDIDKIRFYFQRLLRFTNQDKAPTTLIDYLSTMLSLAAQQTIINKGALAKDENQAALLALAIYFGDEKFELLVGEISQLSSKEQQHREYLITHVKLSKRNDLQQHYIYSLAIQIFSNMGVSNTIGELKELLDSNLGGSGFSFADLMADRAGTKLAMIATYSSESALYVQHFFTPLKKNKQLIILPCFGDLEEGLSQVNFEHNYRNVNSEAYQTMIAIIDQRIIQLDLYRFSVN